MPRTKRPVRKQEKTTENNDVLKKLDKLGKYTTTYGETSEYKVKEVIITVVT